MGGLAPKPQMGVDRPHTSRFRRSVLCVPYFQCRLLATLTVTNAVQGKRSRWWKFTGPPNQKSWLRQWYLRCGAVVNNQIRKGLSLRLSVIFLIGELFGKVIQAWLIVSCTVWCWPGEQSAWDNHALACNFAKYSAIFEIVFTHRLSNRPFLIWLLTALPHLKYVATLPCNLSFAMLCVDCLS